MNSQYAAIGDCLPIRPPLGKGRYRAYLVVSQVLFVIINWLLASRNLVIRLH
jgi:hypothetical protein